VKNIRRGVAVAVAWLVTAAGAASAQGRGSVALGDLIEGLGRTTRVLIIGAHPDDEDTNLLAWLTRGQHVETAYLSLNRGDGGQNLIGDELGPMLGMIRTQELLAARRIDGGHQYFTRAYDFGFSKTDSETYAFWPKDSILEDMVAVIRAFRPQVIVSIWSGTPADGHGQHQVSGELARIAFDAAADSVRFPARSTSGLPPWTPLKFYRSVLNFPGMPAPDLTVPNLVTFDVGEYNPLIGQSYAEIAAESRSQHRSQGMGMLQPKGALLDRVRLDASRVTVSPSGDRSLFDGIDTSWARFASTAISPAGHAALDSISGAAIDVQQQVDLLHPAALTPALGRLVALVSLARGGINCPDEVVPQCGGALGDLTASLDAVRDQATQALLDAAGVAVEATAERERVAVGDSVPVTIAVYNRGHAKVSVAGGKVTAEGVTIDLGNPNANVLPDSVIRFGGSVKFGRVTFPWWLENARWEGPEAPQIFNLGGRPVITEMIEGEDRIATSNVRLRLVVDGTGITTTIAPIVYRFADPARGELDHPVVGVPRVSVLLEHEVEYARAGVPFDRMYRVYVQSGVTVVDTVHVRLDLPAGLKADSAERTVVLQSQALGTAFFRVRGTLGVGDAKVIAIVQERKRRPNGTIAISEYKTGYFAIDYSHIQPIRFYRNAITDISAVDVNVPANLSVAYVKGAGDNVEPMLEELNIHTTVVDPAVLPMIDPTKFTTLVIGPRAFGANPALAANAAWVTAFAQNGGTVVTQYGQMEMTAPGILPFPITLTRPADRVTDENAAVTVLDPGARVLNAPNTITQSDFEQWVQERALYMPHTFDAHYHAILSMHDPNEPPNDGALLTTPVGKGAYVYTTLSFFRQLPAGEPGAARLFVNLLSAGLHAPVPSPH
jgi:LmbE family N-acetylglucosaminyl deacetylase